MSDYHNEFGDNRHDESVPEEDFDFDAAFADLQAGLGDVEAAGEEALAELPSAPDRRATPEDFIELTLGMQIPVGQVRQMEAAVKHVEDHGCLAGRKFLHYVLMALVKRLGVAAREAVERSGEEARETARGHGWTPEFGWPEDMVKEADRLAEMEEAEAIQRMKDAGVVPNDADVTIHTMDHPEHQEKPSRNDVLKARLSNIGGLWSNAADRPVSDRQRLPRVTVVELGPNSGLEATDE